MEKIFDKNTGSKVNQIVDVYNYDAETKLFTCVSQTALIKGFGLPAHCTLVIPHKDPEGVNRWDGEKWVDDIEYANKLIIADRVKEINGITSDLESELAKLTLKQSVGRITEEEDKLRVGIINYLIDLDEFPIEDISKDIPVFERTAS